MKRNETLIAQNEKLKEKNKNTRKMNKYSGPTSTSSYIESTGSRIANKFLGIKDSDQDVGTSGISSRFGTFTKFIGDGERNEDKKSETSGDDNNKLLGLNTPDKFEKTSSNLSTHDEKD